MKTVVENLENIEVDIPFCGIPSVENIMSVIMRHDRSLMEDIAGAVLDSVPNEYSLDAVFNAVVGADAETVARHFVSVNKDKVWCCSLGYFVPCVFDGKGLIADLLGENSLDDVSQHARID